MWAIQCAERRRARSGRTERHDAPLLLTRDHGNHQTVARCDRRALEAGARPGMTLAHARALIGGVHAQAFDPEQDTARLHRLGMWAHRFIPAAAIDPDTPVRESPAPDGLICDVTGCAALYGGERRLALTLRAALDRLGFLARVAIGPNIGSAWALAHFGPEPVSVLDGPVPPALAPLATASLRLDGVTEHGLMELGIETVGQLLALPRRALASRFEPELIERIDQALGQSIELLAPMRPKPRLRVERRFDGPTPRLDAIERTLRDLLDQAVAALAQREAGALVVCVELERLSRDGLRTEVHAERVTLSRPSRDAKHLFGLLWTLLERVHLGFGIEGVALTVEQRAGIEHGQRTRWVEHAGHGPERASGRLIDMLSNRLGADRVCRLEAAGSHVPERSWRQTPALRVRRECAAYPVRHRPPDRPTVLLVRPEPVRVMALQPDHPPSRVEWRGESLLIHTGIGPERVGGEWWKGEATKRRGDAATQGEGLLRNRDYYRVQDEHGRWLWVFRQFAGPEPRGDRWFIQGIWG